MKESVFFEILGRSVELEIYAERSGDVRDAVLIFPGGGYSMVCDDREGGPIALEYLTHSVNAFVLKYSVGEDVHYPTHLIEASYAITYLKAHASEYNIDPERIFAVGFSAGGHLAASLGLVGSRREILEPLGLTLGDNLPKGMILGYPVISAREKFHGVSFENLLGKPISTLTEEERNAVSLECHITPDAPPAFVWHTEHDDVVPVIGTLRLAEAYYESGASVDLHIYPYGPHGLALCDERTSWGREDFIQPLAASWLSESVEWMRTVR